MLNIYVAQNNLNFNLNSIQFNSHGLTVIIYNKLRLSQRGKFLFHGVLESIQRSNVGFLQFKGQKFRSYFNGDLYLSHFQSFIEVFFNKKRNEYYRDDLQMHLCRADSCMIEMSATLVCSDNTLTVAIRIHVFDCTNSNCQIRHLYGIPCCTNDSII